MSLAFRRSLAGIFAALLAVLPLPAAARAEKVTETRTIRIDPGYQQQEFEGWGTSLVWFANATGGYPEPIRRKLADMLFGPDGLDLNIARYNIGGGNAPGVRTNYMKNGATMPGFWKAPAGTTVADREWWNPDDPSHWDLAADANQRWWIDQIKDDVTIWEAFSNSPPYFQTVSGYVSGGFDSSADQIRADRVDEFATYLTTVASHIGDAHGIDFATIDPLNEPNTNYWGTTLGADGQPTGGRQEGAHAGPALQQAVILALRDKASRAGMTVSAMDETNPGIFMTNWNAYRAEARDAVSQLNVHTYGTGSRTSVRDVAKAAGKRLWMSEVEGNWGPGTTDYTGMLPGLGIATRMVDDIRELEPSAWVFWQPIEDAVPQQAGNGNWGSIHIPFNCTADATLETCPIKTNSKFDTIRNFTRHIRPGDRFVKVDDTSTVAALKPSRDDLTLVHVNSSAVDRTVNIDLSAFRSVRSGASVTPVVTSASGALIKGSPVRVRGDLATLTVPAQSVTTFLVDGVRGVDRDAALIQSGHVYRVQGVASGRSLIPNTGGTGAVVRTTAAGDPAQLWSITKLTSGNTNRERYAVSVAASGARLAVRDSILVLEPPPTTGQKPAEAGSAADVGASAATAVAVGKGGAAPAAAGGGGAAAVDEAAQWILSSTGDGTWTLVNVGSGRLLDVTGQATADGSPVGTYTPSSGANQRWAIVDETVLRTRTVAAHTVPRLVPTLPERVTPVYRDGARGSLPVVWNMPDERRWRRPGKVTVTGTATDPLGGTHRATAVVTVDTFVRTLPAKATTYPGGRPALPATVTGAGRHGGRAELPVTWEVPVLDRLGEFPVTGTATVADGTTLPATATVTVVEPIEVNAALDDGVTVSATYTESGYSAAGLRNGDRSEKAWSNWRSGTKNPSDTITVTLPAERDPTRVVTYFYRDGANLSFPASLRVQLLGADGVWSDASADIPVPTEGSPVVDIPVTSAGPVTAARIVMTARPSGYITVSEVEVNAKAVP
ncbi:RICIN domain-containing protein [Actinoplanes hulinensis]|uniref:RICIN domain-containing protein n=1 Tax=Actinoplanes hulinensis TaxID=1144547 RepID=A0ABS7BGV8_9ACTN|nr:RICIN domain-containing protein [Actinoplanes hulinensis]MBW6440124.1 RICIN domain-containing protein [Actinoplanes hulinensis]